ncbi:MAG: Transcriptional regulatory protein OmpR [Alphaproteobacteria bacterium MarineAlpha5_Bin11]|nr:MAG: Transcriptional regulatory protein OmpR [Alphaproteobacteria bacterium MarineAlpha5_Bin11]PPR51959.1 MAG: Transcriptional regulatory protein OmpR [Alphaproteobacteria bacterium MarineAlpha5_Bin10]|tara:strand:- start:6210 stop:6884 length:675 start_codon:yes stop_codon:yes gene_type:complete
MEKNILLVDDDDRLRSLISTYLEDKGYKISICKDIEEVDNLTKYFIFDLIILDRMLPGGDGLDLIETLRSRTNTPILLLTALGEPQDRISGLKNGAEDYLTKPFEPEELYLRINSILKRYENTYSKNSLVSFGDFSFNLKTLKLKKGGIDVYLTEGEKNLLYVLSKKMNSTVPREYLTQNEFEESDLRKVDVQITRIRQKIEKNPKKPSFIQTIRGSGYRLITD